MKSFAGLTILEWSALVFGIACVAWIYSLPTAQFADPPVRNEDGRIEIRLSEDDWCGATPTDGCIVSDWNGIFGRYKIDPEVQYATLRYYGEGGDCASRDDRSGPQDTVELIVPKERVAPC